jgi:hypothetical protein
LRAAHDIGALNVKKAVHAGAGAERAGKAVATRSADADADKLLDAIMLDSYGQPVTQPLLVR